MTCLCEPPEDAAAYLGQKLDKVLTWSDPPVDGRVKGMLTGGIPCWFTVGRVGEFTQFSVHIEPQGFSMEALGTFALYDRAVEVIEALEEVPCTFAIGRYDYDKAPHGEEPPMAAVQYILMRSVSEPFTFVTTKTSSLILVMPRVPARELAMRLEMFEAECRIELQDRHRWHFGACQCDPPLSISSLFQKCWDQAGRGSLFSPQDLRAAS